MASVTRPRVESVLPSDLVEYAREGKIRIPSFQRSYRWERSDVTQLFDSIMRGYPIGNLLVWQRPAKAGQVVIGHLTIDAPALGEAYWVVDGQQRITSLVGALTATSDTVDPRFRIYFDLEKGQFVSLARRTSPGVDQMPLSLLLSTARTNAWLRARPHLSDEQLALADQVVAAIRDYRIPMYIVAGDDESALRDIFDRMNTFGKPLRSAEVFNALHSIAADREPSDLRTLAAAVRAFGYGEFSDQILMQSLLAIRHPKVDRDFRNEFKDDEDRHRSLLATEKALGHVIDFLRDEAGIPHIKLVPYALFIPVLARFMALFGPPDGRAAELLRRWIWRGAVLGVAPQGNTVGLRQGAGAVRSDPTTSANRLLELLPRGAAAWTPELAQTRLNRAQAKVNILGLLSRSPRLLTPGLGRVGDLIDPVQLLEAGAPLQSLIDDSGDLGRGIANRIVHPPAPAGVNLREVLLREDLDVRVLYSHCLDAQMVDVLRSGRTSLFLERRAEIVRKVIADHVQAHALFGFRDGPDVTALLDEDGDND
jgi:hypothetical protein